MISTDHKELVYKLRHGTGLPVLSKIMNEAADVIEQMDKELKDCRNQLCLECGLYRERYMGTCNGCRWQKGTNK